MIHVRAPSRLHFGLLRLPGAGGEHGPARRFGGVGLMVEQPGVRVTLSPAAAWSAEGPLAERALAFAHRFAPTLPPDALMPQHLRVESGAAEHSGLGTGTQLALAIARALAVAAGQADLDATELARRVGRGLRSALGVHGFAQGGFLVEAGKGAESALAPLVARADFPEPWRVILITPPGSVGRHGGDEQEAFEQLAAGRGEPARTDALCRLVLLGMLPALAERDLEAFGEAFFDFNVRVGESFAPVQGGTYAGPTVADLVVYLRRQGVRGVGQSSWGPTVFAITADPEQARDLAARVRAHFNLERERVEVTRAANRGAEWQDGR